MDVYEDGQKLSLRMEIPGVKIEDIDVRVENRHAHDLAANGGSAAKTKKKTSIASERRYGSFARTFNLPQTLETDNVAAHCENGILTIELPKKPGSQAEADQGGDQRQMNSVHGWVGLKGHRGCPFAQLSTRQRRKSLTSLRSVG